MMEVKLKIERDLVRRSAPNSGWVDLTTVSVYEELERESTDEYLEYIYTSREQVLLDFLSSIGYNVRLEELFVDSEPVEVLVIEE